MPTQVQGLISPVYEPIISVSSDGEILTQAALTNLAVALGNRIQFIADQIGIVSATPEKFSVMQEDFRGFAIGLVSPALSFGNPGHIIGDSGAWAATIIGTSNEPDIEPGAGTPTSNHGEMKITGRTATNGLSLVKGGNRFIAASSPQIQNGIPQGFNFSRILKLKCDMVFNTAITAPHKFEFGLFSAQTAINGAASYAVSILYDPGISANWQFKTSVPAGSTLTDSGVPPNVGNYQSLNIAADPTLTGKFSFWIINQAAIAPGTVPVTPLTNVPIPGDVGFFGFKNLCAIGQSQTVDFLYMGLNASTRY